MDRKRRFRLAFAAMAVVGVLGAGVSAWVGLGVEFVAFCGMVGIGAVVVLTRGRSLVAPVMTSIGMVAAFLAVVYGGRNLLLGLLFAVLAVVAIARGSQYHRAYNT